LLRFNYFFIVDLTNENLNHQDSQSFELFRKETPYTSFLAEVDQYFYKDSFYFYDSETMLIRTMDNEALVLSNLNQIKDKSGRRQNITNIDFKIYDALRADFNHPENKAISISAIDLYIYFAKKHFADTGIDFLAGYDPPEKKEIVKSIKTDTTIRSKIKILKGKLIQIQFDDEVRTIQYNDVHHVELIKTLTIDGTTSRIVINQKEGSIIILNYLHENVVAENDFKLLEDYISPELPF
jgi:hypothetical protein